MALYNYDLPEINERLELLYMVLQYCSKQQLYHNRKMFSIGERIAINQERAALEDFVNYLFGEMPREDVRMYQVPDRLEDKITWSIHLMKQANYIYNGRSEYLEHLKKY